MKVYGKIVKTLPKERIIKVLGQNKIHYLYMSRKFFKDFGPYFYYNPYVFVNVSAEKKQFGDYHCQEIDSFNKIVQSTKREKSYITTWTQSRKG